MTLLSPDASRLLLLKYMTGNVAAGSPVARLYTNSHSPATGDTIANYTESSASGYSPITLTSATWTFATNTGIDSATYPSISFSYSASETCQGYMITDSSDVLLWSEQFTSPISFSSGGGVLVLNPALVLSN